MTIIKTYKTTEPHNTALRFSIILAGDKGVPNEVVEIEGGYAVVADDDRAVAFVQE